VIGAVICIAHTPDQFTQQHAELLGVLREPFAIALSNSIRYKKLQQFQELLVEDNRFLRKELLHTIGEEIIGADFGLKGVMDMVHQVAPLSSPVLLLGETGTGKEVIASAIHNLSDRNQGSFIKVNCGAIPEDLMDSELFGHEKGAFTGAISRKKGRFERANGGTIFLDEVGELQPDAQVRLLRVLQEKEIERVGGTESTKVDIRVIAATHRDLKSMIQEGTFREDLFFRLNVFPISIPPLRRRTVDIPALLQHFLHKKAREMGRKTVSPLASGVLERLTTYSWPGNVRELQNAVERELIVTRGEPLRFQEILEITPALPGVEHETVSQGFPEPRQPEEVLALNDVVSQYIRRVLELTGGKVGGKGGAAELLHINPSTLRKRMRKLGIPFGRNT
jgi:transcriptional regulator with GAF, ATPase, and Fis domain